MSLAPPPPLLFAGPNAIVKLGCLLLALPPVACTRTALELTSENWDREAAFVKFYRPGCDRCRALEPAWSAIEAEQLGSDALVVAQVDCIGSGLELCARFGVKGFPSVLSFSPPDYEQGEVYDGSRDVESLLNFAAGLGPACSLTHPGECSADELLRLEEYANMRPEEREQKLAEMQIHLAEAEQRHEALLEELKAEHKESEEHVEAVKRSVRPKLRLVKAAAASVARGPLYRPKAEAKDEV